MESRISTSAFAHKLRRLAIAAVSGIIIFTAVTVIAAMASSAGVPILASINSTGTDSGTGSSYDPVVSGDGRYVAFWSYAADLVGTDSNGATDVFVLDLEGGPSILVSVNVTGTDSANDSSYYPVINSDGRYVAFESVANNLVTTDTNGLLDVYARDLQGGTTTLVSVNSAGTDSGNGSSDKAVISSDGRYVAFVSAASNLVVSDTNGVKDVFVRDMQGGGTTLVSVSVAGTDSGNGISGSPAISADGRYVAFRSSASNLVITDTNGTSDVFLRDLQGGVTMMVSLNAAGTDSGNGYSAAPAISADGGLVAFESDAANLVVTDTNGSNDVFVWDRQGVTTTMVSLNSSGTDSANGYSDFPAISADGCYVVFQSDAGDLVITDTNGTRDVFVRDLQGGATTLVSANVAGTDSGNDVSGPPAISADGRYVAFRSSASNLVVTDTNDVSDVFVWDLLISATTLVSVNSSGTDSGNDSSDAPVISSDGTVVAFYSFASDLVITDTNTTVDAFAFEQEEIILADLEVSKTDLIDPVYAGEVLTYTLTVTNHGPLQAQGVAVTENLPDGVTFGSTAGCAEDPNGVPTCSLGDIEVSAYKTFTVVLTVDSSTITNPITNEVVVSADSTDIHPSNDVATEDTSVVTEADLEVVKTDLADPVNAGEPLTYTVTVTNHGPSQAQNVVVAETLPSGVTFSSTTGCAEDPTGVPTCSLAEIDISASKTFTVVVTVDSSTASGPLSNDVEVSSDTTDGDTLDNAASEDTDVTTAADLVVFKADAEDPVESTELVTYTVTVSNNGPSDAVSVIMTDTLTAGTTGATISSATPDQGSCDPPTATNVSCNLGDIAASAQVLVEVVVETTTSGVITNAVSVSSSTPESAPGDEQTSEETTVVAHDHWGETWSGSGTGLKLVSSGNAGLRAQANGTSGVTEGVYGSSESTEGRAVFGRANAATGMSFGVYGLSLSDQGSGVYGYADATTGVTYGVYGYAKSTTGRGVYGNVSATSGFTYGVYGLSDSTAGRGVYGYANATTGVPIGVYGSAASDSGAGVYGYAEATTGNKSAGVMGTVGSPDGWAGKFTSSYGNGVYISVPSHKIGLTVAQGSKNAVVPTADGARLLYAEEATEVWFSDYGSGRLREGSATVTIDPIYAQTVNLHEPYHVFVQVQGDAVTYVGERTPEQFIVRMRDGDPDAIFVYRVVAKRWGHEGRRLERAPWADEDPNLYPGAGPQWENVAVTPESIGSSSVEPYGRVGDDTSEAAEVDRGYTAAADGETLGPLSFTTSVTHDHWGESWSGSGTGLRLVSTNGTGASGQSSASTGVSYGVYGTSLSGAGRGVFGGVIATTGPAVGVVGQSASVQGCGVYGTASATSGVTYGVFGSALSTAGRGVFGYADAISGTTYGVFGKIVSPSGRAVWGCSDALIGSTNGVHGVAASTEGRGVYGYASATSGNCTGVWGMVRSPDGWSGRFTSSYGNGVYISVPANKPGLNVAQGTKNAVVGTADGARLLYVEEASGVWFADYGFGETRGGQAVVPIDSIFAQTVNLDQPYHVFLQAYGAARVYVGKLADDQFVVWVADGELDVGFSYRVVARRRGHEERRLERAPWADEDPNLYPDVGVQWDPDVAGAEDLAGRDEAQADGSDAHTDAGDGRSAGRAAESEAAIRPSAAIAAAPHDHWAEIWSGIATGLTVTSVDGTGIEGRSNAAAGMTYGVYGLSKSTEGRGTYGYASATTGLTYGVYGLSLSDKGRGVYGYAKSTTGSIYGVYGHSSSGDGRGVYGYANAATGVTYGVYGITKSDTGDGVLGEVSATSGTTYGVYGQSASTRGRGVYGYATSVTGDTSGVWGMVRSPNSWAGRFISSYGKGVYVSVPVGKEGLNVVSGTKNAVVATDDGARLLYAEESTEVWFTDYGFGTLVDGVAVISVDPIYAQTVNMEEPYLVFVQGYGDVQVYVSELGRDQFVVRARDGDPEAAFSYRVVAKRLQYERHRLERARWADDDPNLN